MIGRKAHRIQHFRLGHHEAAGHVASIYRKSQLAWGRYQKSITNAFRGLGSICLPLAGGEPERTFAALERAAERWALAVPERDNEAKRLARRLHGRVPVIVGAGYLDVAARRWAAQLNENSKQWAFAAALPEADHNLVLGFPAPPAARELLHAVFLDAASVHPRTRLRVGLTAGLLDDAGVAHDTVAVDGDSMLESLLLAIYLGDWVSLYLAMLNDADPTEMAALEELKVALAQRA